jgi:hypothetical protein
MSRNLVPILLSTLVAAAAAQDVPRATASATVGLALEQSSMLRTGSGLVLTGGVEHQLSGRFSTRIDGLLVYFPAPVGAVAVAGGLCARGATCSSSSSDANVAIWAMGASARYNLQGPDGGTYVMGGLGTYFFLDDPTYHGALRPGISVGFGSELRVGQMRIALETGYHRILGIHNGPQWLLPVTLGIRI